MNKLSKDQQKDRAVIRKTIAALILPIILENMLGLLAGFINSAMLGYVDLIGLSSSYEVSVQGLGQSMNGIFWNLFKGISIAVTVLIAQSFGEANEEKSQHITTQSLFALFVLGLVCGAIVFILAPLLISFYKPNPDMAEDAIKYLKISALGFPFLALMHSVTGSLQGRSNTRVPMLISALLNLVNIVTTWLLVYQGLGMRFFNVNGAVATAISLIFAQAIAACVGIIYLHRHKMIKHTKAVDRKLQRSFYRIGLPSAFEQIFWQAAAIVLGRIILQLGETAYAANNLGLQAEGFSEMPALGFGVTTMTLTGRALGMHDEELRQAYMSELKKSAMLVVTFGSILLLVFPTQLMSLLTTDQEVISLGAVYLRLMGLIQIPQNFQRVYTGALKGKGDTRTPMLIAGIGLWGIRVPFSLIAFHVFNAPIQVIWSIVCIDQTFRFILAGIAYRRQNWKNITIG